MTAPLSPIAFACEVLRKLMDEQARQLTEDGPLSVLVEDIETLHSGLALAGAALGVVPAPIVTRTGVALLPPPAEPPKRGRAKLSAEERRARKKAYQEQWRARQKKPQAGGAQAS
jgi:hypothetical protein